jgi:hypothetical protein
MNHNISMTLVFFLCLAALIFAFNIETHAAPLPEKITSPQLQRTDCISQEDESDDDFAPYIEEFVFTDDRAGISLYSCVNWRDGFLKSEGVGKKQSRRAAELVARNNALKTLIVMNVNADATLQTYFQRQKDVLLKIQNVLIKNATIQDLPADPEKPDEAKVLVTIPFYGISGLVSFFLNDQEIYLSPQTPRSDSSSDTGQSDATGYTGILIDATALPLEPALFPQIVSEDGEVLYSASQVEKEALTGQGMVEYVRERDRIVAWRAGERPLIIRPVLLASAEPVTSAGLPASLPVMTTPLPMREPWNILAEAKSRGGRGRANALTVNASETDGKQPVNVVVSLEDAQKIKQANAERQVDRQGNYTVLIGREIGGVQGLLGGEKYAMQPYDVLHWK